MAEARRTRQPVCPGLCRLLMQRFQTPCPGVRLYQVRFAGYTGQEIKRAFRYLCRRRVLVATFARDANGDRYGGMLVALTALGQAVLSTLELTPEPLPSGMC